jgi:hypothetical protein
MIRVSWFLKHSEELKDKSRKNAVGDPPKDKSWIPLGSTKLLTSVGDHSLRFLAFGDRYERQ